MRLLFLAAICTFTLLLSACDICSKKVPCPAFEDEIMESWFPYDAATVLKFRNGTQVQELTLSSSVSSPAYTATQSRGQGCNANRTISSKETITGGSAALYLRLEKYEPFYSNDDERKAFLMLYGLEMEGDYLGEKGFSQVFNRSQGGTGMLKYYNSLTLGGKAFTEVQQISFDTGLAKKPPVYNIYISRRTGIVAYQTYNSALLWVKE